MAKTPLHRYNTTKLKGEGTVSQVCKGIQVYKNKYINKFTHLYIFNMKVSQCSFLIFFNTSLIRKSLNVFITLDVV